MKICNEQKRKKNHEEKELVKKIWSVSYAKCKNEVTLKYCQTKWEAAWKKGVVGDNDDDEYDVYEKKERSAAMKNYYFIANKMNSTCDEQHFFPSRLSYSMVKLQARQIDINYVDDSVLPMLGACSLPSLLQFYPHISFYFFFLFSLLHLNKWTAMSSRISLQQR